MGVPIAVTAVAAVWLAIALVTLGALAAVLVALVRHALLVGRAARRLAEELAAVQEEVASLRARAPGPQRRRR